MKSTLELLKEELIKRNAFNTKLPQFFEDLVKTIPNTRIPEKMKLTIAVSELILFASQFKRNIIHWNNSLIPINAITFCISASGTGKDSSINLIRKNFSKSYKLINSFRNTQAIELAISKAKQAKEVGYSLESVYMKYYEPPMPLFVSTSTNEGYIRYLNELDEQGIGAGYIFSGEIGAEFINSQNIIANLQLLSELYDEGKKEVKVLKNRENQSKEIKNLAVSAMFMGSPENILFDDNVKRKFKQEFTTKLARRTFFNFNYLPPIHHKYISIAQLLEMETASEDEAVKLQQKYNDIFEQITKYQLNKINAPITISKEARELMTLYRKYNIEVGETIDKRFPLSKLVQTHLYWKALKLAGALSFLRQSDEISKDDYARAIYFTEMLNFDMQEFEQELVKEPYELFTVYMNQNINDENKCQIDIHNLKKLGFINGSSNIPTKLKELCALASVYDKNGIYRPTSTSIEFEKLIKSSQVGVSFLALNGDKNSRHTNVSAGFTYTTTSFSNLREMLKKDGAFCPFEFKDGIRSNETIISGTKWAVFDIDKSDFTIYETHEVLKEFNHHLVLTSDETNLYKFRLLVELDSIIDLTPEEYKKFMRNLAIYLGVTPDILPKSQIYYSYSGRNILSVVNKNTINVKQRLLEILEYSNQLTPNSSDLTQNQKKALIADPLNTFYYAFEAKDGEGSISLIRAAKHAKDLGMNKDEIIELMYQINDYWVYPMEEKRFKNTIISQIQKW